MIEDLLDPYHVKLHGFYDYRTALTDSSVENGGVAYSDKLREFALKVEGEWYFIESGDSVSKAEVGLVDLLRSNVDPEDFTRFNVPPVTVNYNVVTRDGEKSVNILGFTTTATAKAPISPTPKATKEDYEKVKDYGTF